VRDEFVRLLVEKTKTITIGNPLNRDVYLGPVINEDAVRTYERAIDQARKDGGQILTGGRRLTDGDFAYGHFVEPTIIDGLLVDGTRHRRTVLRPAVHARAKPRTHPVMVLDAAVTLEAVRWTARLSALLLTVNLIVVSRRVRVRGGSPWRAIDAGTFGAFLGSHTVHFIFLIVLASGTDGRSIRDSGGWIPAIVVATIFYLGCGTAMRVKLRPAT